MTEIVNAMPGWWSLLPPLVAILAALWLREVYSALLIGIIVGCVLVAYAQFGWLGLPEGLLKPVEIITKVLAPENGDSGHASVIVFTLLIGAMVSMVHSNGSMQALINWMAKRATTKKRGLLITWAMGVAIFFDDFANTLIVGSTMRPLTDRLGISREKLAYIVDSTAAPVAAIALVTTWIGAELLFIGDGIKGLEGFPAGHGPYLIFLTSLKYMFYPILTLAFILILILTGRDFGAMLSAERDPRFTKGHEVKQGNGRIWQGALPVFAMLGMTVFGLYVTGLRKLDGLEPTVSNIIGAADSFKALLWGSYLSVLVAAATSIPAIGFKDTVDAALEGFKKMIPAVLIIVLAWSLAELTTEMGTGAYISQLLAGSMDAALLPLLTFATAGIVAFATGSSWGTMAILYPVAIPAVWSLGMDHGGMEHAYELMVNSVACVLAGSVLGDHCSPISDTTIMSSLASDCDHLAHVRTQMPYALTVGAVAAMAGTLPAAFGWPLWLCFALSLLLLYAIVSYFGQRA